MVLTPSTMLPLGTAAPDFTLPEPATNSHISLKDVMKSNGLLVTFISNHCPFVQLVTSQLQALGTDLQALSVGMVAIASNDTENYPQDGPEAMAAMAKTKLTSFPYLLDESQAVAKAYRAACTPDFFLFDAQGRLVYRYAFGFSGFHSFILSTFIIIPLYSHLFFCFHTCTAGS